jgi:hypothetical protein
MDYTAPQVRTPQFSLHWTYHLYSYDPQPLKHRVSLLTQLNYCFIIEKTSRNNEMHIWRHGVYREATVKFTELILSVINLIIHF